MARTVRAAVDVHDAAGGTAIALEGYSLHGPGNPAIAPELGGIVRLGLVDHARIHEVAPSGLKKFATGKGNARKDAIMLAVYRRWRYDCDGDDNRADAYVLARMVLAAYCGDDLLTKPQGAALEAAGLSGLTWAQELPAGEREQGDLFAALDGPGR